jgi:polyisoprenoid-binding protein YceI
MHVRVVPSLVLGLLLCGSGASAAVTATVDPAHTSASFSVRHLTLTTVSGSIPLKSATIAIGDGNALTKAEATFDISKIDTHEPDRDADLRSDHFFDVEKFPDMTFKSTKVEPGTGGAMTIDGDLTMHGVTKPVSLAAKYEGTVKDPRGRTHVGYSATVTIDRTLWGIGTNYPPAVVGNDITITIELEALET